MSHSKILSIVFFILLTGITLFLYRNAFWGYFFQDDWFTLTVGNAKSPTDVLNLFVPRTDIIYYRPFGMQMPFFLMQRAFGQNAFAFHLTTYVFILLNSVLAYILLFKISKRKIASLLLSFLYATSSIHFIPIYWTSTIAFVLGTTLFLGSFLLYLKQSRLSLLLFAIGLCTTELVIALPAILLAFETLLGKRRVKHCIPFFLLALIYIVIRFTLFNPPTTGVYTLSLGIDVIHSVKAYLLWSFNLPEEIKAQFISFFRLNPDFIRDFGSFTNVFFATLAINIVVYAVSFFVSIKKQKTKTIKILLFGILWFISGLAPVLFFPKHSFTYYLEISLIGLLIPYCLFIDEVINSIPKKYMAVSMLFIGIVSINWVYAAQTTIAFNEKVHWAPQRSILSKKLVEKIYKDYPKKPKNKKIYVYDSSENRLSLNEQDAVRVLFNDQRMKTVYIR